MPVFPIVQQWWHFASVLLRISHDVLYMSYFLVLKSQNCQKVIYAEESSGLTLDPFIYIGFFSIWFAETQTNSLAYPLLENTK